MILKIRNRALALLVATYMILILTAPASASMVSSMVSEPKAANGETTTEEIEKIQQALEHKLVKEKLEAYGLTSEEVQAKLVNMTDGQVHTLAQASDDVLAGGDGLGIIIAILVIVLLVILILKLMDKDIIIA